MLEPQASQVLPSADLTKPNLQVVIPVAVQTSALDPHALHLPSTRKYPPLQTKQLTVASEFSLQVVQLSITHIVQAPNFVK